MNSKRSIWKLLVGVACVGLFVTNCTVKTESDNDDDSSGCTVGKKKDCSACDNGVTGSQTCQDDGSYGPCVCPGSVNGGGSNGGGSNGGAANTAGASASGGASDTAGYAGTATDGGASSAGEGGEGGAAPIVIDPNDCVDCLTKLCAPEWDACADEDEDHPQDPINAPGDYCLSKDIDGTGQIESVLGCIEAERAKGLVKREAVRACGASLGKSSDPSFFLWPPNQMTAATTGVINCMADAPDESENPGAWADSTNIPTSGSPKPWLDMTCAKLSCTSGK